MNNLFHDHYHAVRELEQILDALRVPHHKLKPHPEYESQRSEGGRNGINSK